MRVWRGLAAATLVALGVLVAGCGAGPASPFYEFFGGGSSPGSAYSEQQPGRVQGLIVTRNRDGRVLIVGSAAELTEPTTPLPGVTVSIVQLALTGQTGATGTYLFTDLTPGDYTLRITLPAGQGGATADFAFRLIPGQTLAGLPAGANL
ncbi:MAG: hypothetical protein IT204_14425 [Fimbriimonadaceae bacterium]|nr:hypothetical protein [Fimbriimonadaceae bacterium]